MEKKFLTYDEQLTRLSEHKKITITDRDKALQILKTHSYYNFINSTKICFAAGKDNDGSHVYNQSEFDNWVSYYYETNMIKAILIQEILKTETILNSLLSYYITDEYLRTGILERFTESYIGCCRELKEFKDIENTIVENDVIKKSWMYVPKLTFGKIVNIYYKTPISFKQENFSILKYSCKELKTMVGIRNKLVHNTPLLIAINDKNSHNRNNKRELVKKMLKPYIQISEDYEKYDDFILNYNQKIAQFGDRDNQ